MHELAICQNLLNEVTRVAIANGADEVTGVVVAIGPLSGVVALLLERAFEIARAGTVAESAELAVEEMPVIVRCKICGEESAAAANALLCAHCGTWQVDVTSGEELLLKRVTLAGAPAVAAN